MLARTLALILVALIAACGGSSAPTPNPSPTAPTPPAPAPTTWAVGGVLTDALTGARVPGATLTFNGFPTSTSDGNGEWQLQGSGAWPGTFVIVATISAPGFLDRDTRIEWKSGGRSDVSLSLIPDRAPFSLEFFRQLARNAYEATEFLEPIRRWDENPNFYLNAMNPKTGQKLLASEIQMIEDTIRHTIPQLTGGNLAAGVIEVGVTDRGQRLGYVNIDIIYEPEGDSCGRAFVGSNPGRITLNYDRCRVWWCNEGISPNVLAHEVGHAMGFWHVPDGVMVAGMDDCKGTNFTEEERLHARIAYQRPSGNRDVDRDPPSFEAMTTDNAPLITCRRLPRR